MEDGEKTAYIYQPEHNPSGAFFSGVPLRNLTVAEVEALPRYLRRSIANTKMYRATRLATPLEEDDQKALDREARARQQSTTIEAGDPPRVQSKPKGARIQPAPVPAPTPVQEPEQPAEPAREDD